MSNPCCPSEKKRIDWLMWISMILIVVGYASHLLGLFQDIEKIKILTDSFYELMNKMWIGLVAGIIFVGLLTQIPRQFVISIIGKPNTVTGVLRATLAGVLLDLCSHGILLVGLKLYERGASLGQTMAFLIASPWNSISLTIILITLIGWKATLIFLVMSAVIAVISGLLFHVFERHRILPANPNEIELPKDFSFWKDAKQGLRQTKFNRAFFVSIFKDGWNDSQMILRWIFFGVVLASLIRVLMPQESFQEWFGPTLSGLGLTLVAATIMEVCSEGLAPVAADIVTRAKALGNGFVFLMAGVSTDYTEVMGIKERTGSWKIALFLPLVTLPQILILGYLLNQI